MEDAEFLRMQSQYVCNRDGIMEEPFFIGLLDKCAQKAEADERKSKEMQWRDHLESDLP